MRPDKHLPAHARGFGLVAAMFVMIVISLVIIAMTRLSTAQHGSNSLAIQQARAYQASQAGLEWGVVQAIRNNSCVAAQSPSLAGSALSEFSVTVSCGSTSYVDNNGSPVAILRITAEAQNGTPGSRPDYAFRRLSAVVERLP
ncbi:hypothetical protein ACX0MV_02545 [Pseudomonas borbori]